MDDNTRIAKTYSELVTDINLESLDQKKATEAANRLNQYGLECNEYISRKLKTADVQELKKLLKVVRHFDHPEIEDGLTEVVVNRIIPLDLKVDYFKLMADLGFSLDSDFLNQLQEADELYLQLGSQLKTNNQDAKKRALALAEDFHSLPLNLKLSLVVVLVEEWRARAIPFLIHILGNDKRLDLQIIDVLVDHPGDASLTALDELVKSKPEKELLKKAKRAVYILKEKGYELAREEVEEVSIVRDENEDSEQCYTTTFDSFGSRLVLFASSTLSRVTVCKGSISDVTGILRFSVAEMHRKDFKDYLKALKEQVKTQGVSTLIKVEPAYCKWLLNSSYEKNLKKGTLIPESFKSFKYKLSQPEDFRYEDFLKSRVTPTEEDLVAIKQNPESLFAIQEISVWMVEKELLLSYTQRYVEAAESELFVDEQQKRNHLDGIVGDFSAEYFNELRLSQLSSRLEETAYLLHSKSQQADARKLLALAEDLSNCKDLKTNQFLKTFMLRSMVGTIQAFSNQNPENKA